MHDILGKGTMVSRKRIVLVGVGAVAVGLAAAWWLTRPAPTPWRQQYDRVWCGMCLDEAVDLLGPPDAGPAGVALVAQRGSGRMVWSSKDGREAVIVEFAPGGPGGPPRVAIKGYYPPTAPEAAWYAARSRLREWLGW
jgi:hypothetical protein